MAAVRLGSRLLLCALQRSAVSPQSALTFSQLITGHLVRSRRASVSVKGACLIQEQAAPETTYMQPHTACLRSSKWNRLQQLLALWLSTQERY